MAIPMSPKLFTSRNKTNSTDDIHNQDINHIGYNKKGAAHLRQLLIALQKSLQV